MSRDKVDVAGRAADAYNQRVGGEGIWRSRTYLDRAEGMRAAGLLE